MIVKSEIVVYNGVVGVVCFEQVLKCSRSLFGGGFDVVYLNRGQVDGQM